MSNKNKVSVSVIIPTLNRPRTLNRTLESICSGDAMPLQVIVIDQSDKDKIRIENQELCRKYNDYIQVQYIYQKIQSSTMARNCGMKLVEQPYILFCDDDVSIKSDTFRELESIMLRPDISMVAGIDLNGGLGHSLSGYLFGRKSFINRHIGHVTLSVYGRFPAAKITKEVETQWAMGFFFCIKKEYVDRWDVKWDEQLTSYAYAEDLDFSYSYYKKSLEEGLKCILTPKVAVYHMCSREWRISTYKSVAMNVINREYLSYKHFKTPFSRLATRWSNVGEFFIKLLRRDCPLDVVCAQLSCDLHRKELQRGHIAAGVYERGKKRQQVQKLGEN